MPHLPDRPKSTRGHFLLNALYMVRNAPTCALFGVLIRLEAQVLFNGALSHARVVVGMPTTPSATVVK